MVEPLQGQCISSSRARYGVVPVATIILCLLYLCFFVDCMNAVLIKHMGQHNWYSQVSRGITELVFCFLLFRARCFYPLIILAFFSFINFFGLGVLFLATEKIEFHELFQNIVIVNKFVYFFVVLYVLHLYFYNDGLRRALFKFFEICFFVFCVSIVIGFLFQIDYFRSYPVGSRFGYKGVIVTTNEAVGLMLVGIFYFYKKYLDSKKLFDLFVVFFLYLCSILVGSKASFVFVSLALLILVVPKLNSRPILLGFVSFLLLFLVVSSMFLIDKFQSTINYIAYFYNKGDSITSILLTGRNWRVETLFEELFVQGGYPLFNYVFGGFNFVRLGTEMDFFDVMTLFGLFGIIFYVVYIRSIWFFSGKNKMALSFLLLFLAASTLGGHLIYNAVIPVYLAILTMRFSGSKSRALTGEKCC